VTRLLSALLALLAGTAVAQEPSPEDAEAPRWFRVELVVLANLSGQDHRAEFWDLLPPLDYPSQYRFLVDPEAAARHFEIYSGLAPGARWSWHEARSSVDERGRQTITLLPSPPPVLTEIEPARPDSRLRLPGAAETPPDAPGSAEAPPGGPAPAPPAGETASAGTDERDADPVLLTPVPFVTLEPADRALNGAARAIQRSGRYDILFHEAWVQPFADRDSALPLVLDRSGDEGDWPRLQGSITLYLSRYLHLVTDLWLNTDGAYLEQPWQMPAPPLGPPRLIVDRSALQPLLAPVRPDALLPGRQPLSPSRPDAVTAAGDGDPRLALRAWRRWLGRTSSSSNSIRGTVSPQAPPGRLSNPPERRRTPRRPADRLGSGGG